MMAKSDKSDKIADMTANLKLPKGHTLVETSDGTYTFFSESFQEACHSTSGAKTETILHYLEGCKILEKTKLHNPLMILEVGFGLGVGLLTTIEHFPEDKELNFISLEIDKNLTQWFSDEHPEFNFRWNDNILEGKLNNINVTIITGDARTALPEFLKTHHVKWHAVYQDAFSPKRNPVLWTKEWFTLIRDHSHEDVILSTYSASSSIRKSLHETGWGVQKGEKFGPKRTSTRAYLSKQTDPEILEQLNRSPVAALTDLQLK